ncbi:MAG: hypothetical protein AAF843_20295 [Bacteroidota bacterium]
MPANKKYLLNTRLGRTSKILAAIFGSLFATMSFHVAAAVWTDPINALVTSLFSIFIIWPLLMLMVYWIAKPWKSWTILLSITLIFGVLTYLGKM